MSRIVSKNNNNKNKRVMEKLAFDAGMVAAHALVPYAADAGKQLARYAGGKVGKMVASYGNPSKAAARVQREMNSGVIPHVSGAPTSIGVRMGQSKPRFSTANQVVTITHREPLRSVYSTNNSGVLDAGVVNPFNPYLFPWLATIAGSYDMYKFTKISVEYFPVCSTNTTGQVTIAWDPAGNDGIPDYYDLMMMPSTTTTAWMPASLNIPASTKKYMGEQASSSSVGSDFYNHGRLIIGTLGTGTGLFGNMFINYTVQLYSPQPSVGLSSVIAPSDVVSNTNFVTGVGLEGFIVRTNGLGLLMPSGTWKLEVYAEGTVLGDGAWGGTFGLVNAQSFANSAFTKLLGSCILLSDGSGSAYVTHKLVFTTLTKYQVRITRLDTTSYTNSSIVV